jgi:hypothetical protein
MHCTAWHAQRHGDPAALITHNRMIQPLCAAIASATSCISASTAAGAAAAPHLVDPDGAAHELLVVQVLNGLVGTALEGHKGKATRPAGRSRKSSTGAGQSVLQHENKCTAACTGSERDQIGSRRKQREYMHAATHRSKTARQVIVTSPGGHQREQHR